MSVSSRDAAPASRTGARGDDERAGLRLLTFGTLYPDASRPQHGIFVEHRLRQLVARGGIEARVVAPVPWFPSRHPRFGTWSAFAAVAPRERRHGIEVEHPRFLVVPKIGMLAAPALLAAGARPALRRLVDAGWDFDCLDAQYFYPDGVAAVRLGREFDRPVVITARGSDVNVIARLRLPRRMIVAAAREAAAVVTVSAALRAALVDLGVPAGRIEVLRNGVDLTAFRPPVARDALRESLGLGGFTLLSVGNLVPLKGHVLVIEALRNLPDVALVIAGAGPCEAPLRRAIEAHGLTGRVRLLGRVGQAELAGWYGAADALVLASQSEGLPNVALEAMACGTPVVATAVGGTPEVVAAPEAGELIAERTAAGIVHAVVSLRARLPERAGTRAWAEGFSWDATAAGLHALFTRVVTRGARAATPPA